MVWVVWGVGGCGMWEVNIYRYTLILEVHVDAGLPRTAEQIMYCEGVSGTKPRSHVSCQALTPVQGCIC